MTNDERLKREDADTVDLTADTSLEITPRFGTSAASKKLARGVADAMTRLGKDAANEGGKDAG